METQRNENTEPLMIRFSEILKSVNGPVPDRTRTACGPNNGWDDADVGSHSQLGEYD